MKKKKEGNDEGDSKPSHDCERHNESPFTNVDEENGITVDPSSQEQVVRPGTVRVAGPGRDQDVESLRSIDSLQDSIRHPRGEIRSTIPPVVLEARLVENDDRTQILDENRRLREQVDSAAQAQVILVSSDGGKSDIIVRPWWSRNKRLSLCVVLALVLGVVLGVVFGVVFGGNTTSSTPEPTPVPMPTPSPVANSETIPQSSHPTLEPSPAPSPVPPPLISQSVIVPNRTENFDHLKLEGFTPADEPNIYKISQVRVYSTLVCGNSDCTLPLPVISLVVTYVLGDCTISTRTNGAYTTGDSKPAGTINLKSDQFITRIELLTDRYVTHIKICTSEGECFGPFGSNLEQEPSTIFEKPNSFIKAFYGFSGSWLNALGVYFEEVGNGPSSPTCD